MPRRAAPGHRARLEGALTPSLRAALEELSDLFLLGDWQRSGLGPVFHEAAVLLEARRLASCDDLSEKDAIDAAAIHLGVSADTIRSRFRDWYRESREGGLSTPTRKRSAATVDEDDRIADQESAP